ncbi:hypothetical protein [Dysgonomonas sp. BGC7]|uniref:hypothetical protein n=1 Tax=Dysgonomonas sp. BGC7 TaxID=1658008 RepID=UPI00067FCF68|nr:hypothetical protein [Dysgonomonas sp. BGC7]MBD8389025.1 hypothetical protein [Dysgonomonas sp. BGC7]
MDKISFLDIVYHDTELNELKINLVYNDISNLSFVLTDIENNKWQCSFDNIQRIQSDIYLNHTGNAILLADISKEDSLYKSFVDFFHTKDDILCYVIETTSGTLKFLTKDCGKFLKL